MLVHGVECSLTVPPAEQLGRSFPCFFDEAQWRRPAPCRFDANRFQQWCAARNFFEEIKGVDDQGPHEATGRQVREIGVGCLDDVVQQLVGWSPE